MDNHGKKDFTGKMMALKSHLSIVIINMNGLNAPMRWHRVVDWIK